MWKLGVAAWLAILFVTQPALAAESYELQQLEQRKQALKQDFMKLNGNVSGEYMRSFAAKLHTHH